MKKEPIWIWLSGLFVEAVDRYRLAKRAASRAITETKTKVWEEFRNAGRRSTFEEVLKPTNMSSCEEAKSKDLGGDSFVSLAEVTEGSHAASQWEGVRCG